MNRHRIGLALLLALLGFMEPHVAFAQLMIVGIDEKVGWDDAGKLAFSPPGKDVVSIVDIGTNPERTQTVRQLIGTRIKLLVSQRPFPMGHGDRVWRSSGLSTY